MTDFPLLVGSGPMAEAYAHPLKAMGRTPTVIGRGEASAQAFEDRTGFAVVRGGLDAWLASGAELPASAIVALPVPVLAASAEALIEAGVKRLLVEKPAGLDPEETRRLSDTATAAGAEVFVAYNRRFYASTRRVREMIAEDGGLTSFRFEFGEFAHRIREVGPDPRVAAQWFYANSTHVIDMAFFLGGHPARLSAARHGGLDWHGAGAVFTGHGETSDGVPFTYHADWESAPRWAVHMHTRKRVLSLQPLEKIVTRPVDGFAETAVDLDDALDTEFKPGLHGQVAAFLDGTGADGLVSIADHAHTMETVYRTMRDGGTLGG